MHLFPPCSLVDQLRHTERHARNDQDAVNHLIALLEAITSCCTSISPRSHEQMLSVVLGMPLWSSQSAVRGAVLSLVANLVAASGQCVTLCLEMLVGSILPPVQGQLVQTGDVSSGSFLFSLNPLPCVSALLPLTPPTNQTIMLWSLLPSLLATYPTLSFRLCHSPPSLSVCLPFRLLPLNFCPFL